MTKKTVVMAAAAAMGFAASADVVEVKFTVKTDVGSKVASKVISGLYDTEDSSKYVFWTTEKEKVGKKTVSTNKVITGSYFGFVNETNVAKKVGQNAELIWGEEGKEDVLVAGAWGTDKSKSGQAAGTFNGAPATGTWSAKLNTKKSFEELCTKNKVGQDANKRPQGVIADLNDKIAAAEEKAAADVKAAEEKAAADVKAAEEKAAADVKAAEEKAAADVKAAEEKGAEALADAQAKAAKDLADAQDKAAKDLADAQDKAAKDLADAQAKAAKDLADAQAKAAKDLADKQQELDDAVAKLDVMKGSLSEALNDPDMPNMFSDYLDETAATASNLLNEATANIANAQEKFDAYTNSLDVAALQKDYDDKKKAYESASNLVEALTVTNRMIGIIDGGAGELEAYFEYRKQVASNAVANAKSVIDLAQASFPSYTNLLAYFVQSTSNALEVATTNAYNAKVAFEAADVELAAAKAAFDNYEAPTYENGGLKSFDDYIAEQEAAGETFAGEIAKHNAYDAYKAQAESNALNQVSNRLQNAQSDYDTKKADSNLKEAELESAKTAYSEADGNLKKAIADGKMPVQAELEKDLADKEAVLEKLDEEYEFWKNFSYSDADRAKYDQELTDAREDRDDKETAMDDAKNALDNVGSLQYDRLAQLLGAIGKGTSDMYDENGRSLPPEAFIEMFEEYMATQNGYLDSANTTLAAVEDVRNELGL